MYDTLIQLLEKGRQKGIPDDLVYSAVLARFKHHIAAKHPVDLEGQRRLIVKAWSQAAEDVHKLLDGDNNA